MVCCSRAPDHHRRRPTAGSYCNIAVALDAEGEDNGPLGVIPGVTARRTHSVACRKHSVGASLSRLAGSHREGHLGGEAGLDPASVDGRAAVYPLLQAWRRRRCR